MAYIKAESGTGRLKKEEMFRFKQLYYGLPKQLRFWKIFLVKLFGIDRSKQFFFKNLLTFGINKRCGYVLQKISFTVAI